MRSTHDYQTKILQLIVIWYTGFVPQIVIIEYNQLLHFGLIEWFVDLIKNVLYMINMTTVIFKHFRPPIFMDSFA